MKINAMPERESTRPQDRSNNFLRVSLGLIKYLPTPIFGINKDDGSKKMEEIAKDGKSEYDLISEKARKNSQVRFYTPIGNKTETLKIIENGYEESQKDWVAKLNKAIEANNPKQISEVLVNWLEGLFSDFKEDEIRPGVFNQMKQMVQRLTWYEDLPLVSSILQEMNYSTVHHSLSTCALVLNFFGYLKRNEKRIKKNQLTKWAYEDLMAEVGVNSVNEIVINTVAMSALLHDVGKVLIDEKILTADRKLTEEEFEIIKRHPMDGYLLIKKMGGSETVAQVALRHHRKKNNHGYPNLGQLYTWDQQLVGICDVYEAITAKFRGYQKNDEQRSDKIKEEAIRILASDCARDYYDWNKIALFADSVNLLKQATDEYLNERS